VSGGEYVSEYRVTGANGVQRVPGDGGARVRGTRRRRLLATISIVLVLVLLAFLAVRAITTRLVLLETCRFRSADGQVTFRPDQAANAATISAVALRRGLPEQAVVIAVATAIQESKLRNIEYGDRDSVGLFQQRPSQGWGTEAQLLDPVYSASRFFDALVQVPGYTELPVTVAAQRVQRSAYPTAYADHEDEGRVVAAVLVGRSPGALACSLRGPRKQQGGVSSAVVESRAESVRTRMLRDFGDMLSAQPAVRAAASPARDGSAVVSGSRVDVHFRSTDGEPPRRGWAVARWAVAHAKELGITRVVYGDQVWSRDRPRDGWRPLEDTSAGSTPVGQVRIEVSSV